MAPKQRSPTKLHNAAEWLILNEVDHAGRRKQILGSVVPQLAKYSPFDSYSPYWADEDLNVEMETGDNSVSKKEVLRDAIEKLWASQVDYEGDELTDKSQEFTAVKFNDIVTGKIAAKTQGMRTTTSPLFGLIILKDKLEGELVEYRSIKCYKIDQPDLKLQDTLLPCVPWREQLQKLFDRTIQQRSPFLLVTGILVCEALMVRWTRKDATKLGSSMTVDGSTLLAALHQPPDPEIATELDNNFAFDQEKSTSESIVATYKHEVIFAVRYHYLDLVFERTPDAGEPNIFMKLLFNAPKAGTIKSAKTKEVVLGLGIPRNAYAYVKQSKKHGKDKKEDEEDDENEDQEEEEDEDEDEEEFDNVDWSEIRPTPELEKDYEDQNDEAMQQSVSVTAQVDGHMRG